MKLTEKRTEFIDAANAAGFIDSITRKEAMGVASEAGLNYPQWLKKDKISHGVYRLPSILPSGVTVRAESEVIAPRLESDLPAVSTLSGSNLESITGEIPPLNPNFVEFAYFKKLKKIVKSRKFFPVYLTGLSGIGKTEFVYQACAESRRALVRFNLNDETTKDDLFGGFRLINGSTDFYHGPVSQAMHLGAVLLLDEADQCPPTVSMALQAILEGKPYLVPETGELIHPKPGFTIIAAANTKGKGDDSDQFVGSHIQNEANLDRYLVTFEHHYPPVDIEIKIMTNIFKDLGHSGDFIDRFIDTSVTWANSIRKGYTEGSEVETLSPRRLIHMAKVFDIFGNKQEAVNLCISRFEPAIATAWAETFRVTDPIWDVSTPAKFTNWEKQEELRRIEELKHGADPAGDDIIDADISPEGDTDGDDVPW